MDIEILINEKKYQVPRFTRVHDILKLADIEFECAYENNPVVAVFLNGQPTSLTRAVETSGEIKPIRVFEATGRRIYRHSICYLLFYAAKTACPDRHLVIGHSLGDGYFFSFDDGNPADEKTITSIRKAMTDAVKADFPIVSTRIGYEEACRYFKDSGLDDTVLMLECNNDPIVNVYRMNNYYDVAYETLCDRTSVLSVWELRQYNNGMLLRYPVSSNVKEVVDFRDEPLLFSVFEENKKAGKILGARCLGQMNRIISKGDIAQFVRLSEALQRRKIASIADMAFRKGSKAVFISGPSSSGKTTFAKRLCEQFMLMDLNPIRISLDDYYMPMDQCPKDENGKPDLETIDALKLDLFKQNMTDLFSGKDVDLPHYNFAKQETYYLGKPVRLDERTVFVFEGIHGLNPKITSCIDSKYEFKIYISALTQLNLDDHNRISTTDNRIIRRIIRDYRTRATSATMTLEMWASVSRGERKHIFPYQNNADVMFNSAADYEIGVLSPFVQPLLKEIPPSSPDAYHIARRILEFLKNVYTIPPTLVPSDSLIREFIGQSDYE